MPIDLLVVNLYPFEATVAKGAGYDECVENIDVGGPAMIRGAAKNHDSVTVVVEPQDYERVLAEMSANDGATTLGFRKELAAKAFARTAAYDAAISNWFAGELGSVAPEWRAFGGRLGQALRYGENAHQSAALYISDRSRTGVATRASAAGQGTLLQQHQRHGCGVRTRVCEFDAKTPAVAIIKHANPCGVAVGSSIKDAYREGARLRSHECLSAASSRSISRIDRSAAEEIAKIFTEVVIAPDATDEAKAIFAAKKNLRLLLTGGLADSRAPGLLVRSVAGGFLVQSRDHGNADDLDLKVVTKRAPTDAELADLRFAFKVAKHVKSNAIVYAKSGATVGIGAGQMSRVDSARIAALEGGRRREGARSARRR